jgi:hypothetical protein
VSSALAALRSTTTINAKKRKETKEKSRKNEREISETADAGVELCDL